MGNKLTAVEWLEDQIIDNKDIYIKGNTLMIPNDIFRKAKQMDKEQKQEFYNEGKDFSSYTYDEQYGGVEYWDREPLGFEDYYNKQYGKS
jgi:hypothetical protein